MDAQVKREIVEALGARKASRKVDKPLAVIELSSSDSESDDSSEDSGDFVAGKRPRVPRGACGSSRKKQRKLEVALPPGFLEPLPVERRLPMPAPEPVVLSTTPVVAQKRALGSVGVESCKQFWKAGDYEGDSFADWEISSGGMDHVRVHPKFLHSNATSHKWALGAFAELLDNALDEVCSGATHANIDVLENKKDSSRMLLIEDNGGGMDPDKMRQCMSLGYSAKSKLANAIGQYGNGFKTSTMRLGADVIVFSRCSGQTGKGPTQSIGLLSYTFLRSTGKEDIVVPMLDYERAGSQWSKIQRSSAIDWNRNLETIVQWSPYFDEADLLQQFNVMKDHGTRIIIYNLWEDDEEQLELDFNADLHDIQIRGVNRDEKNIAMAKQYPNSKHFLTYKHSLRSYVSILYLRLPPSFRIILRGKDVEHHNIVNDMMMTQEVTYRPQPGADGVPKDSNMFAVVTMGFVKDAKYHIDVQGFNVYHKNRLIKPFWRLWNAAGSDGRGVIGVLEANFVEPAHDKQGFERTTVLARLEARLVQMQKTYWSSHCHKIGYAARRRKTMNESASRETSPDYVPETSSQPKKKSTASRSKTPLPYSDKFSHKQVGKGGERSPKAPGVGHANGHVSSKGVGGVHTSKFVRANSLEVSSPSVEDVDGEDMLPEERANSSIHNKSIAKKSFGKDGSHSTLSSPHLENTEAPKDPAFWEKTVQIATESQPKGKDAHLDAANSSLCTIHQLEEENQSLRERLKRTKEEILGDVVCDLQYERDRCKSLESQLNEARNKIEEMNKEQESLIDIFSEERARRDSQENDLRKKLKDAANTVQELLDKVKLLEKMRSPTHKMGRK